MYGHRERGFTLIELLIVVVVIGILAAIAVPQFATVKIKSFDGAAKADLRNMIVAQEDYFTDSQAYADVAVAPGGLADLDTDGTEDFRASQRVALQVTGYTDGFQITSEHGASPNTWCVNSSSSQATAPGAIVKSSSC